MRWSQYSKYEQSNAPWLDCKPNHWGEGRVKRIFDVQLGKMLQNDPASDKDALVPYIKAIHVQWDRVETEELPKMWARPAEITQYGAQAGDLLVCEGGEPGRSSIIARVQRPCIIQNALHRVRSDRDVYLHFLQHLLLAIATQGWFDVLCNKTTISHLTREKLVDLQILLPPICEQRAIVSFLDRKTQQIDTLIVKKERQINLLQEKRSALVPQTVAKGRDPNVTLKDSGVEWLGKIPEHWKVKAVWMVFKLGRGRIISNQEISDNPGPYPVFSSQTADQGIFGHLDSYDFDGHYLTWTTDGIAGRVFERTGRFNCTNVCGTLRAKVRLDYTFFAHALNQATSWFVRPDINPKLMNNVMSSIRLPVPPLEEQFRICCFIKQQTNYIDDLVSRIQSSIASLREYRTALISAAVTGKIDVRDEIEVPKEAG